MSDAAVMIGEYQLRNLIVNRVQFLYLDLRESKARDTETVGHELLIGSVPANLGSVLEIVKSTGTPHDGPIVLICENGTKSVAVAEELARNSFINVFIVEGGTRAFSGGAQK